jgi:hypothetical protein
MELEKAKQILNFKRANKLTEEQVKEILELLATTTMINLKNQIKDEKCHPLCKSVHG